MNNSNLLAVQCYSNEVSGKGGHCHEPVKISCMRALGRACCSALHKIPYHKKSHQSNQRHPTQLVQSK